MDLLGAPLSYQHSLLQLQQLLEVLKNDRTISLFEDVPEKNRSTKEEVDIIDGVHFISFESESDLFEFTRKQKMAIEKLRERRKKYEKEKEGRIIPTKTHDITKIKGWRNKVFITNLDTSSDFILNVEQPEDSKSNSNNSTKETEINIEQTVSDNQNIIKERVTSEILSNNRIFLREFPDMLPRMHQICFIKKYSNILTKTNEIYIDSIKNDFFLEKIKNELPDKTSNEGIFQCSFTDEFLEKHAHFDVSYGHIDSRHWDEAKYEEALELVSKNRERKLPIDLIDVDDKPNKTHLEVVAEAYSKFNTFAEETGKFKLKKYIVIKGKHVQLDFGKSRNSDSDVHKSILVDDYNLTSSIKEEPCEPLSVENTLISQNLSVKESNEINDPVFTLHGFNSPQGLVLALPCSMTEDAHPNCFNIDTENAQLAVTLNIGVKRPLNEDVIKNLELLKKHPQIIDNCWANIAASAVQNTNYKTVKRIVVPVVSEKLKDIAKLSIENLRKIKEIEVEVKNVVEDAIDYIVRKEAIEKLDYAFDPDVNPTTVSTIEKPVLKKSKKSKVERELRRLINVTLVEESKNLNNNENNCGKDYCSKGCVCQSLNGSLSILHCKKIECMFECSCINKNTPPREKIVSHGVIKNKLAKEESLWHKTVICKSNDVIIEGETGKVKREKKLPTRFRNNVLLYSLDITPNPQTNRRDVTTNSLKQCPKGLKLSTKKCDTKSPSKIEPSKVLESENSGFDCFKKPLPPKPKSPKNGLHHPKKSTDSAKLSSMSLTNQSPKSFNSVKEPLKDMLNVNKDLSDNCNTNILKEDFLPPDFDEESLIEMEEIIVSSDEEEDPAEGVDPLDDAFIWCTVHSAYNCQCCNPIFFLKTNTICRCRDRLTSLSRKHVSAALVNAYNFSMAHLHDRNIYSARTFGSHINYSVRNKSPGFKTKRKLEMNYGILSNTNSLYKLSMLQLRDVVKKDKIVEHTEASVTVHDVKAESNDFVKNTEDIFVDVEEAEINEISKTDSLDQPLHPFSINQPLHVDQEEALGQSPQTECPQDTEQSSISPQYTNVKSKSVNDVSLEVNDIGVEPEKENKGRRKKYRIGPAHFDTSRSYRTIVAKLKPPKLPKSLNCNSNIEKNVVSDMPNNNLKSSQNDITDNFNSTANINSEKEYINGFVDENSDTHQLGLLCLTDGFGYLPVNHFSSIKLSVKDPLFDNIYHSFKDLEAANIWLNRFFKSRILFEDLNFNLKWVIIKPNLMAKMKLFDKNFLLYDTKAVNKNGVLMDKKQFTAEYLRASKKSHIQTYKADLEQTSLPANNTIKFLLENGAQENEIIIPNKRVKTEHSNASEAVDTSFSPLVIIDPTDLQNMKKNVFKTTSENVSNRLRLDTCLKRNSNRQVNSSNDLNVLETTSSEENPTKRLKLVPYQERFPTKLKVNPLNSKPAPRTINVGNHAPGSNKRYTIQIDF